MARLIALARSVHRNGRPLTADPVFRQRLVDLEMRVEAMKYHMLRQLTDQVRGRNPGIEAMVNKLAGTELNHDIATAAMEAIGDYATLARGEEDAMDRAFGPYEWMFSLGLGIGGGTSAVQKKSMPEHALR